MKEKVNKLLKVFLSFLSFALLTSAVYLARNVSAPGPAQSSPAGSLIKNYRYDETYFRPVSDYRISAELNIPTNTLFVSEKITWRNLTKHSTNKVYFHLYPNAYSSTESKFMHGRTLTDEQVTRIIIKKISVDGSEKSLEYHFPDENYKSDSTVAFLNLGRTIAEGDSVNIHIEYSLYVPEAFGRWGRDSDNDLYFFAQWFTKTGVFKNGYWFCQPFHSFAEFYSDFSDYELELTIPGNFRAGSSGKTLGKRSEGNNDIYIFSSHYVTDFSFFVHRNLHAFNERYKGSSGKTININYYLRDINRSNYHRVSYAVQKGIEFLEKNIGEYPFENLTLIDIPPGMGEVANMEYPGLFTFESTFFPSIGTRYPEKVIIHELVHQYFYAAVSSNETREAWLDEGITSYLTSKILNKVYGRQNSSFRVFNYYTIYGIEFLTLRGLPVIYTLTSVELPVFTSALIPYYRYARAGSLSQPSDQLFNAGAYFAISYNKTELLLATIENYLPGGKLMKILSDYYNAYKFRHATSDNLKNLLINSGSPEIEKLLKVFYETAAVCDYAVTGIEVKKGAVNVFVQRVEDAVVPVTVALYTVKDTLYKKITPAERITRVIFNTDHRISGAEVDPGRKNLLDINFANNSFAYSYSAEGLIYITLRWFFWMQSLLIVSGGLA